MHTVAGTVMRNEALVGGLIAPPCERKARIYPHKRRPSALPVSIRCRRNAVNSLAA